MLKRLNLRKWTNIFKTLAITLAPVYVPVLLLWHFGFRIESTLASILFVQIYVLVIQAEAMLRQSAWSMAAYDAIFRVSADVSSEGTTIEVANCGNTPAYNFFIALRDETIGNPIEYTEITCYGDEFGEPEGHMLSAQRERRFLVRIPQEEFHKRRIRLRISYDNVLGHSREVQEVSFEGSEEFLMIPMPVEHGFLIKAYGDLMPLFRWHFRYKKSLGK